MDRQPVLEGERLLLRPLRECDRDALFAVASDPDIWALHPAHDRWRDDVFRGFFDDALLQGGALLVIEKATDEVIGSSRFQNLREENGGEVEIGWTFLARNHWGTGANAEMKRLMIAHALQWVERAIFCVGADNVISRRAMANIGARLTDRTEVRFYAGEDQPYVIYEITRADFASGPLQAGSS